MAFPAQCNFSGFKYPLDWVTKIHQGYLNPITTLNGFYIEEENVQMTTSQPIIGTYIIVFSLHNTVFVRVLIFSFLFIHADSTHKWYVVLDAASYVASNKLDLSQNRPDFVAVSFYKMFGWPTGLDDA
jgi:molybdenum cofactor sulfurtransferase